MSEENKVALVVEGDGPRQELRRGNKLRSMAGNPRYGPQVNNAFCSIKDGLKRSCIRSALVGPPTLNEVGEHMFCVSVSIVDTNGYGSISTVPIKGR